MIKKVVILLFIIVCVLLLGKNFIISKGASLFVQSKSDMKLEIDRFKLSLLQSRLGIDQLAFYNSKKFENERVVSIPKIYIDLSVPELISGDIYIYDFTLNLEEFVIVKNKEGEINLKEFEAFKGKKDKKKTDKKETEKQKRKSDFYIENFELVIGNVIYKDYSVEGEPKVQVFEIGIDRKYKNIGSPVMLANLITVEALTRTSIAQLSNMDLGAMKTATQGILNTGVNVSKKALEKGTKTLEGLEDKAKKSLERIKSEAEKLVPTPVE